MPTANETKLIEIRAARHKLLTGKAATDVWDGESRVVYQAVVLEDLDREIAALEGAIAIESGAPAGGRRPLSFVR